MSRCILLRTVREPLPDRLLLTTFKHNAALSGDGGVEKRWWLCISARAKEGRNALLQGRHALYKSNIARIHISQRDFFMQQRRDLRFPLSLLSAVLTRNTRVWLRNFHFGLAC